MELTQHKRGNSAQDIQVSYIVNGLIKYYAISDFETFKDKFKTQVEKIPATNAYKASFFYKVIETNNPETVEVWKMKANSEPNYKMFTITIK